MYVHELGHYASSKKFGVICQEMGFGIYVIFPILYSNLGEAWRLHKQKRIIINLSGIYFQLIIGGLIGVVSFFSNSNILIFLFYSNLTIIFLNFNPFFKLDGYWLVADLLNIKNLSRKSNNLIKIILSLKIKNIKKSWLLVYSVLKIIFFSYLIILIINLLFSLITKIYNLHPLTFRDYILIFILFFYAYKTIKRKYNEPSK
jgi:putative peptide zinc metalloprotease protein